MDISPALATPLGGRDLAADEQLAIAAREDSAAFGMLYERHVERVFRFLRARGASEELAADLTAVTLLVGGAPACAACLAEKGGAS